jgi:hypothetical protein
MRLHKLIQIFDGVVVINRSVDDPFSGCAPHTDHCKLMKLLINEEKVRATPKPQLSIRSETWVKLNGVF